VNIQEALELPVLKKGRLLTDRDAIKDRDITWVSIIEVPVDEFIRMGEFVVSTGMNIGQDPLLLSRFVEEVAAAGASALGIAIGPYTPSIPTRIVKVADRVRLPLLEIPWEIRFSEISEAILKRLIQEHIAVRCRGDFVWSLANGSGTEEAIAAQGKQFGFDASKKYVAVVGKISRVLKQSPLNAQAQVRFVEGLCSASANQNQIHWLGTVVGDTVVGFFQLPQTKRRVHALLTAIQTKTRDRCTISWGVGHICRDFADFRNSYEEANIACDIGIRVRGEGALTDVSDVLADRVLMRLRQDPDALRLLDRYVEPLRRDTRVPLLRTIETFFDSDCNASATARRLSISRQSLLYRLNKAETVLDIDFSNAEHRFAICLSLRLHKLRGGSNTQKRTS
jgi:DNA-binding PucR family transcriptional regulator